MKRACVFINADTNNAIDQLITQNHRLWNKTALTSYALNFIVAYFAKYHTLPAIDAKIQPINEAKEMGAEASDLPGMTPEVIQSHLVRFPRVTPEAYKCIIEELRQRQQSDEGLKNPEAAAYGLCKRIQNGQPRTGSTPQEQHQAQPATVPEDNPFAIYEP